MPAASEAAAAAVDLSPGPPARRLPSALVLAVALTASLVGDAFNPPARQWSGRAAAAAVSAYRESVSPLLARGRFLQCRFTPTCSLYGLEALRRHGFFRGSALAAWRVLRCNPLSKGGFDPVP